MPIDKDLHIPHSVTEKNDMNDKLRVFCGRF